MKISLMALAMFIGTSAGSAQGTIQIDQISTNTIEGAAPWSLQPMGQSFTPSLTAIGWIELNLFYSEPSNPSGTFALVNVRSNSITGPILGSTATTFIPTDFYGITNFVFAAPVALTPGTTYYLQPFIFSGGHVSSYVTDASYGGGSEFLQGSALTDRNLWFREGIQVPEPSIAALILVAFYFSASARRRSIWTQQWLSRKV
jgi:hypothetical protein